MKTRTYQFWLTLALFITLSLGMRSHLKIHKNTFENAEVSKDSDTATFSEPNVNDPDRLQIPLIPLPADYETISSANDNAALLQASSKTSTAPHIGKTSLFGTSVAGSAFEDANRYDVNLRPNRI